MFKPLNWRNKRSQLLDQLELFDFESFLESLIKSEHVPYLHEIDYIARLIEMRDNCSSRLIGLLFSAKPSSIISCTSERLIEKLVCYFRDNQSEKSHEHKFINFAKLDQHNPHETFKFLQALSQATTSSLTLTFSHSFSWNIKTIANSLSKLLKNSNQEIILLHYQILYYSMDLLLTSDAAIDLETSVLLVNQHLTEILSTGVVECEELFCKLYGISFLYFHKYSLLFQQKLFYESLDFSNFYISSENLCLIFKFVFQTMEIICYKFPESVQEITDRLAFLLISNEQIANFDKSLQNQAIQLGSLSLANILNKLEQSFIETFIGSLITMLPEALSLDDTETGSNNSIPENIDLILYLLCRIVPQINSNSIWKMYFASLSSIFISRNDDQLKLKILSSLCGFHSVNSELFSTFLDFCSNLPANNLRLTSHIFNVYFEIFYQSDFSNLALESLLVFIERSLEMFLLGNLEIASFSLKAITRILKKVSFSTLEQKNKILKFWFTLTENYFLKTGNWNDELQSLITEFAIASPSFIGDSRLEFGYSMAFSNEKFTNLNKVLKCLINETGASYFQALFFVTLWNIHSRKNNQEMVSLLCDSSFIRYKCTKVAELIIVKCFEIPKSDQILQKISFELLNCLISHFSFTRNLSLKILKILFSRYPALSWDLEFIERLVRLISSYNVSDLEDSQFLKNLNTFFEFLLQGSLLNAPLILNSIFHIIKAIENSDTCFEIFLRVISSSENTSSYIVHELGLLGKTRIFLDGEHFKVGQLSEACKRLVLSDKSLGRNLANRLYNFEISSKCAPDIAFNLLQSFYEQSKINDAGIDLDPLEHKMSSIPSTFQDNIDLNLGFIFYINLLSEWHTKRGSSLSISFIDLVIQLLNSQTRNRCCELKLPVIVFSMQLLVSCSDLYHPQIISLGSLIIRNLFSVLEEMNRKIYSLTSLEDILVKKLLDSCVSFIRSWILKLKPNDSKAMLLKSISTLLQCSRSQDQSCTDVMLTSTLKIIWSVSVDLSISLVKRFTEFPNLKIQLKSLILNDIKRCLGSSEALSFLIENCKVIQLDNILDEFVYFAYPSPVMCITCFTMKFQDYPIIANFSLRALSSFPSENIFFYIPQIVQCLRFDKLGLVSRFILDESQRSSLFAHQVIWNMNANLFLDENQLKENDLKPILENLTNEIVNSLTGQDREFYEREFSFFEKVTNISASLKPFIKKSKLEKKKKIDDEMKKIRVDPGVYLPSNPESTVVDIDYFSGRPLQSHAKAPFMATFQIKDSTRNGQLTWQASIFKVGDDCRQDVLALQIISMLKNIFEFMKLNIFLYPYRVVATAPGCGVIQVIPNSISRDELGREKINNIYDYFLFKFGGLEQDPCFKKVRMNFIQSMAGYSLVTWLLAIKDRHNGNIMLDDQGHIIHIDFGFILDIAPGGITAEQSPFKLTKEMIDVMGGNEQSFYFKLFSDLTVKGYLAARKYSVELRQMIELMTFSGLPCFKYGESIKNFVSRLKLDSSEFEAANFMRSLIKKSFQNSFTGLYDYYQMTTEGIPY